MAGGAGPDDEDIGPQPGDPDYDLSEAYGYGWQPASREPGPPRWLLVVVSLVVLLALVVPGLLFLLDHA
jgi:hypothetical protein